MEQQLRAWLRYSFAFGLYMSPNLKTTYINNRAAAHSKRLAWLERKPIVTKQRLKEICLYIQLVGICVVFVKGLVSLKPIPGMASEAVSTLLYALQALTCIIIVAEGLWRQQQQEAFLRLLHEIEFSLKLRLREDIKLHCWISCARWHLQYLLWLSLICFVVAVYYFMELQHMAYYWHAIWYNTIIRLRIIQLCVYVCVLRNYMACLCMKLQQLVAYRTAPNQQLLDVNYEKLQTLAYLLAIKDIYDLLYKAFELLCEFAGWSLFAIITSCILDYSCTLYWILLSFEGFMETSAYYVAGFWWLVPMTATIWHICYLCHKCSQLDRLLAARLRRLLIMSSSQSMRSYRILLQLFCTQLELQCIVVTGSNFFILDLRLVTAILATMTSQMVMLIQFLCA
ncbi:putative gustatory receptor 39b [Bactrocera dorsalis]|uniref:Gustatory receptor n=1 Tax=Bactrocera dorsalis TaxID=27457 RepID=A0ABM3JNL4_BACDO|nr:putative gustatory receptor 39b [Bactrocera dorsalis]